MALTGLCVGREVTIGTQTDPWEEEANETTEPVTPATRVECKTAYRSCLIDRDCGRAYASARAMCNQSPDQEEEIDECPESCRDAISILSESQAGLDYMFCDCGQVPICQFKLRQLQKCTSLKALQ